MFPETPERRPASCGAELVAFAVMLVVVAAVVAVYGHLIGWWAIW